MCWGRWQAGEGRWYCCREVDVQGCCCRAGVLEVLSAPAQFEQGQRGRVDLEYDLLVLDPGVRGVAHGVGAAHKRVRGGAVQVAPDRHHLRDRYVTGAGHVRRLLDGDRHRVRLRLGQYRQASRWP